MADISKIKLGSTSYDIKDTVARQMISGGLSFNIVWTKNDYDGDPPTAEKLATIPAGVVVYCNEGTDPATGTLPAEDSGSPRLGFYLIYRQTDSTTSHFDEYVATKLNTTTYFWEKIGSTALDLKGLVTDVTLNKQTSTVLGAATDFTNSTSTVTEGNDRVDATVIKTVGKTTATLPTVNVSVNALKSASLTGTKTFNTDAVKASYVSNTETLELSDASTGTVGISTSGADTHQVVDASAEVTVVTDITSTTETVKKSLGTLTAAAQTITVDTNDEISALNHSTSITVSKHS